MAQPNVVDLLEKTQQIYRNGVRSTTCWRVKTEAS
jgi:hypothetical protein